MTAIHSVPVREVLKLMAGTEGKSADQIDVECEVRLMLATRALPDITAVELDAMYEHAGFQVQLRALNERMRAAEAAHLTIPQNPYRAPAND